MAHPMMARANHDERAAQLFTRDLKSFIAQEINPPTRKLAMATEQRLVGEATSFSDVEAVMDDLLLTNSFRTWIAMKRTAQEMMWDAVADSVDRQIEVLTERGRIERPKGSLTLDPDFEAPAYVGRMDTHLMPGGYTVDEGEGGVRQGALMDAGGAVYQLGRPMGRMNDGAGVAVFDHLADLYPEFRPRRILDLGTGLGRAAVAAAEAFPDAEVYAIDVGPTVLRYAHARAEHLGAKIHFSQQNAEATRFEDGFFDLVVSSAIFHETSEPSIPAIIREIFRLLRPGGLTVNIEVPHRYWESDILGKLEAEWETHFNNESSYRAAVSADFDTLFRNVGFEDVTLGWRRVGAVADAPGFTAHNPKPVFALYAASARKSA